MEASSIQTSLLVVSAHTTMANGAFFKKAEPWDLASDNCAMRLLSLTTTNSHGLKPLELGDRRAASIRISQCSELTGLSSNCRMLLLLRNNSINMFTPVFSSIYIALKH